MPRSRLTAKESVFLWSASGVRQVQKPQAAPPEKASRPEPEAKSQPQTHPSSKRRFPRLDMKLPILYRVLGERSSRIPPGVRPYLMAESTNISPIGLCVNLEEPLAAGTVLALTFHVMEKREKFSAVGRVVWFEPAQEPGHFLTGLQFVVVEGESVVREVHGRMESFIEELSAEAQ
jgi:Tfp pilus assembly protein PilZ